MRSGFTLVEMLVVMTILGILTILLFRSYTQSTQVSTRIATQTTLSQGLLETVTILERLSQESNIAFDQYDDTILSETGYTNTLLLYHNDNLTQLTFSGSSCPTPSDNNTTTTSNTTENESTTPSSFGHNCQLYREDHLISHPRLHFSDPGFVITPSQPYENIYELPREEITSPGRWLYGTVHLDSFNPDIRTLKASHPLQLFFRLGL